METHVDQTFMGPVPHQCTVGQGDRNIQRFVSPCVTAARVARLRHISPPNLNPGWTGKPSPIWQPGPAAPTRSAADWTREPMTHRHWQEGEVKPRSRILSSCWVARLGGKSGPIWQPCDCALTLFLLLPFFHRRNIISFVLMSPFRINPNSRCPEVVPIGMPSTRIIGLWVDCIVHCFFQK